MSWYKQLLDTAKDVVPTVAGGAVMFAAIYQLLAASLAALSYGLRRSSAISSAAVMRLLERSNRINEIVAEEYLPRRDGILS